MAMRIINNIEQVESKPKKRKQGRGKHTKYSATASNKAKKKYRGQGRKWTVGTVDQVYNWSGEETLLEKIIVMMRFQSSVISLVLNVDHMSKSIYQKMNLNHKTHVW